ncbi:hypothetical protein [Thalassococcus lentus]|uniref:Uncharacterized protein n=1 Tax=Thalassococcus lentus TaxID=1210524 RepID=A0ABT4XX54_9RHOB|nr:hypothetical protein [Thalassococcus lentus]MDA7426513.1 hypothetical protein [Thalassococcus lentus]
MFKFLFGMATMAALAAYVTNPTQEDAEAEMRVQLMTALANEDLKGKNGAETAALLGCRLNPDTCYDLLRSGIEMTFEDRHLYSKLELEGFERSANCYGLYTRFICPGGLKKD